MQTAEPHIASLLQLDRKMSSDSSKSEQSRSFWPRVLLRFVLFCSCVILKYFESFEHLHWTQAAAVLVTGRLGSNDVPGSLCGGKSKGGKAGCHKNQTVNSTAYLLNSVNLFDPFVYSSCQTETYESHVSFPYICSRSIKPIKHYETFSPPSFVLKFV